MNQCSVPLICKKIIKHSIGYVIDKNLKTNMHTHSFAIIRLYASVITVFFVLCLFPSLSLAYDYSIKIGTVNYIASEEPKTVATYGGSMNMAISNYAIIESGYTPAGTRTWITTTGMTWTPSLTIIKNVATVSVDLGGLDVTSSDVNIKVKNTTSADVMIDLVEMTGGNTLSLDLSAGNLGIGTLNATGLCTLRFLPPLEIASADIALFVKNANLTQANFVLDSFENLAVLNPGETFTLLKASTSLTPPSVLTSPMTTSTGERFAISHNSTENSIEATLETGTTINPATATFDKRSPADIDITITYYGGVTLTGLVCNGVSLNSPGDYEENGATIMIKKEYLATLANGSCQIEFQTSVGRSSRVDLTIKDSTPSPGLDDPDPAIVPVTGVTLNHATLSLITGGTEGLNAIVTPSNATNKTVAWKSSDENVATVDKDGIVTAVGPGTCTITATSNNGKTDTCTVTVTDPVAPPAIEVEVEIDFSGLGLVNGVLPLKPGEAVDLRVTATPSGTTFTATGLPEGLTLTPDGRLHGSVPAIGTYEVTITATAPDGTTRVEKFVVEVTEEGVTVTPEGGSGGGCDAGFGVLALLAPLVLGFAVKRRK